MSGVSHSGFHEYGEHAEALEAFTSENMYLNDRQTLQNHIGPAIFPA